MRILSIAGVIVGGLFALWSLSVCVFLIGGAMKRLNAEFEGREDHASIFRWGCAYSLSLLLVLFGLVRFIRFAWEF